MVPVMLIKLGSYYKKSYCLLLETLSHCLMNCSWVLKSKSKIKQLLSRPCKMDFDAINLTDGWKKWKGTMQLYPAAAINGKANNEKYTGLFFMVGEKWRDPFGFWTLLCHFLVKYGFRWVRMGNLHNTILLMPVFHKTPFLVLHFSYHTLIFLMMLSVIL